jgi:hypothetical protein
MRHPTIDCRSICMDAAAVENGDGDMLPVFSPDIYAKLWCYMYSRGTIS